MKTFFTISLAIIIIGITSCSKQNESPCNDYVSKIFEKNLSDSTKLNIPFTGTDTLIYISNYNDTAILYGKGLEHYVATASALVNNDPACPQRDYYDIETLDYEFNGDNPNLNFLFLRVNYPQILETDEFITTYILNEYNRTRATFGRYSKPIYYTSPVTIKGKTYYGIYFYNDFDRLPALVYNKNYGFLQFIMNDTLTYTLNNIKPWKTQF